MNNNHNKDKKFKNKQFYIEIKTKYKFQMIIRIFKFENEKYQDNCETREEPETCEKN